jgi:hypothetical protein
VKAHNKGSRVPLKNRTGSLPRKLHLFTELIKLLLFQLCHDSVESIDLCSLSLLQFLLGGLLLSLLHSADGFFHFGFFFTCRWMHKLCGFIPEVAGGILCDD